jgi:hypothetical protein
MAGKPLLICEAILDIGTLFFREALFNCIQIWEVLGLHNISYILLTKDIYFLRITERSHYTHVRKYVDIIPSI